MLAAFKTKQNKRQIPNTPNPSKLKGLVFEVFLQLQVKMILCQIHRGTLLTAWGSNALIFMSLRIVSHFLPVYFTVRFQLQPAARKRGHKIWKIQNGVLYYILR